MEHQQEIWRRARLARDARFDGRFFVGVLTTGIYCRPICPARPPRESNVRYFRSAAAAAESGLRPCLRCRPEVAPGAPVRGGTSATVSRALRLIDDGALDDGDVTSLADRLGVGDRHLRRLFAEHLGATPVAVAQTRRLHFAKRLLDETALPVTEIALAAGFGSVRRFNAVVAGAYGRTPSELRRLAIPRPARRDGPFRFVLRFRPPYDWERLIAFLAPRAIPGVETVGEHGTYRRTITVGGRTGTLEARLHPGAPALDVRLGIAEASGLMPAVARVRQMFDLAADPEVIGSCLSGDPLLRPRVAAHPGLRIPGGWDPFEMAVRAVIGQQVSVKGATTIAARLVRRFGQRIDGDAELTHLFPPPERLADADLSGLGLPGARARTIRELARRAAEGALATGRADSLLEISGIGEWTAEYVAMRAFGEPDAFPAGDLVLLKASGLSDRRTLAARSERWRPWRAYAAMHLWQGE